SFRERFDPARVRDRAYYRAYLQAFAVEQDGLYQQAQAMRWSDRLYFLPFAGKLAVGLALALPARLVDRSEATDGNPFNPPGRFAWAEPGQVNRARVAGQPLQLPDFLQAPVPDLNAE